MSGSNDQPPQGAFGIPAEAAAHLSDAEKARLEGKEIARQIHGGQLPPWDPRFHALQQAQRQAAIREADAQQAEASQVPAPPQDYPNAWMVGGDRHPLVGAARGFGFTVDQFTAGASLAQKAEAGATFDADAEMAKLKGMWGANTERNMQIVRAEVRRLGPDVSAWLERSGVGNSSEFAHLVLSAARRYGRAPW